MARVQFSQFAVSRGCFKSVHIRYTLGEGALSRGRMIYQVLAVFYKFQAKLCVKVAEPSFLKYIDLTKDNRRPDNLSLL